MNRRSFFAKLLGLAAAPALAAAACYTTPKAKGNHNTQWGDDGPITIEQLGDTMRITEANGDVKFESLTVRWFEGCAHRPPRAGGEPCRDCMAATRVMRELDEYRYIMNSSIFDTGYPTLRRRDRI